MKFLASLFMILLLDSVKGERNKQVKLPSSLYCGEEYEIDGATVKSNNLASSMFEEKSCSVTFEADDGQFLLNLTDVHIRTCPARLSVSFPDTNLPGYVMDCDQGPPGVVVTTSKYITILLDRNLDDSDYFNIILTSYHQKIWDCEFACDNKYCIDSDLQCDGIDHCSDKSDERPFCVSEFSGFDDINTLDIEATATMGFAVIIGIIVAMLVCCVACCVGIFCCCRRRQGFKGRVLRGPASQNTTVTTVPSQPAAQPLMPMQGSYPPVQPGAYPPPQPASYPPPPAAMPQPQPAPYPPPPQYPQNIAPPPYQEKPTSAPYPAAPPTHQQFQQSSGPSGLMPSAPPTM